MIILHFELFMRLDYPLESGSTNIAAVLILKFIWRNVCFN